MDNLKQLGPVKLPYGRIPAIWTISYVIERVPDTRIFKERGSKIHFAQWLDELHEANPGDLIPLQWAPDFCRVTRPGIRKRIVSGNMTLFSFVLLEETKSILGRVETKESRTSYDYVIKSECEAWREELLQKWDEEMAAKYNEMNRHKDLPPSMRMGKGKR
jgi:hypothetical protein